MKIKLIVATSIALLGTSSIAATTPNNNTVYAAKKKYYFKNNVAKLKGLKIKITAVKFFKADPEVGQKKCIVFEYDITNTSKKSINPDVAWIVNFNAYQSNKNTDGRLEVGSIPMDYENLLDNANQKVKKNGHIKYVIAYELRNSSTPVILKAEDGLYKVYGKQKFKIGTFQMPKQI